jgi:RNA polymerase sigma-70 factor (ECF subfamily)
LTQARPESYIVPYGVLLSFEQQFYSNYLEYAAFIISPSTTFGYTSEDVVHDVFISLLRVVDEFELRSSLAGYLKTSVANKSRDYMRKKRPQAALVTDAGQMPSDNDGPVQLVMQSELAQQLGSAISRLPYEQREAVVLYLHGRMKFKTIAKLQNVSIKTAHSRYRAGLDRLRSMLNSECQE